MAALCKHEKGPEKGNRADKCLVRRTPKGLDSSVWRESMRGHMTEVYNIVKAVRQKLKENDYSPNSTVLGKSSESNTRVKQLK